MLLLFVPRCLLITLKCPSGFFLVSSLLTLVITFFTIVVRVRQLSVFHERGGKKVFRKDCRKKLDLKKIGRKIASNMGMRGS